MKRKKGQQIEMFAAALPVPVKPAPVARDLTPQAEKLLANFEVFSQAEGGVERLRELVWTLAVRGNLVPQDSGDEPAITALKKSGIDLAQWNAIQSSHRFDVPNSWLWIQFGGIGEQRLGKMLDEHKNRGEAKPYLRNTNVQWKRFELQDVKHMRIEKGEEAELKLRFGDLLICEGGEPGRCAIWRDEQTEMYFQKALHRVRPCAAALSEYLVLNLEIDCRNGVLDKYFTGATIKHLTGRALATYPIPLPPLAEQKRIVAKVDELMKLCDELEARQAKQRETGARLTKSALDALATAEGPEELAIAWERVVGNFEGLVSRADDVKKVRETVLSLAVRGRLVEQDPDDLAVVVQRSVAAVDEYPVNWVASTVAELAQLKSGNTFANDRELLAGDFLYVKVSDMNLPENQREIVTSSRFVAPESHELRHIIPENSIIFPKRGGAIATNKKRLVKKAIFVDTNTMAITCPPLVDLEYLHIWFLGIDLWKLNSGTSVPQINNKDIGPLVIPLPPLPEQKRIVAKVDQLMALCDELESKLRLAEETARKVAEALVAELLQG